MIDLDRAVWLCRQGHETAFAELFNHYQHRVYDLACAILRNEQAAEDVVQDTFITVLEKLSTFQGKSTFDTWLTAIVVNHCRMRLRRQKLRQLLSFEQLSPAHLFRMSRNGAQNTDNLVQDRQQKASLWALVDELPDRERIPLILRYRFGMACGEIATALSRRKSTIYQDLNNGRRALEQLAKDRGLLAETVVSEVEDS